VSVVHGEKPSIVVQYIQILLSKKSHYVQYSLFHRENPSRWLTRHPSLTIQNNDHYIHYSVIHRRNTICYASTQSAFVRKSVLTSSIHLWARSGPLAASQHPVRSRPAPVAAPTPPPLATRAGAQGAVAEGG
jgi:hypothetical protein